MYTSPLVSQSEFYQGDIIEDYPFLNLGQVQPLTVSDSGIAESEGEVDAETAKVSVRIDGRRVMIISQTCDAQRRENLLISPIYGINEYSMNADTLRNLRSGKVYYWLYLPAYQSIIEESFVDLQQLMYVPRSKIEEYKTSRILSLSDLGRHHLAWSITNFIGRPFSA